MLCLFTGYFTIISISQQSRHSQDHIRTVPVEEVLVVVSRLVLFLPLIWLKKDPSPSQCTLQLRLVMEVFTRVNTVLVVLGPI